MHSGTDQNPAHLECIRDSGIPSFSLPFDPISVLPDTKPLPDALLRRTAGAIQPFLEEKEKSRKKASTDQLPELTNNELVEAYFSGEELELIALAFKNLVLRIVNTAYGWVKTQRQRITELISRLKETPLLVG